jgi:hypothetical protein
MCKGIRVGLIVAGCVCLVLFGSFNAGSRLVGAAGETRSESWITIGFPWPWYESRTVTVQRADGGSAEGEAGPRLTPAWVFPPLAVGLFLLARWLRKPEVRHDGDEAGPALAAVR